jgi:hypothetical protein
LRAHAGQQVLLSSVDRIFHRYRVAGTQQHPADQVERLLASVGDDEVVARPRQRLPARLIHQVAP